MPIFALFVLLNCSSIVYLPFSLSLFLIFYAVLLGLSGLVIIFHPKLLLHFQYYALCHQYINCRKTAFLLIISVGFSAYFSIALTLFVDQRVHVMEDSTLTFRIQAHHQNAVTAVIVKDPIHPQRQGRTLLIHWESPLPLLLHTYRAHLRLMPLQESLYAGKKIRLYAELGKKMIATARLENVPILVQMPSWIDQQRLSLMNYLHAYFPQQAGVLSALTTGITTYISQQEWQILRQTGTSHLVAISGLHLSIVAGWFFILIRFGTGLMYWQRPAPIRIAALMSIGLALFYTVFSGMNIPTIRAFIMFSILMLGFLLQRRLVSLSGLSIALIITLVMMPYAIFSIGFWFSFMAVTILILLYQRYQHWWISILLSQLMISLLLMPLSGYFFGELSIISPISNVIAIPWMSFFVMPCLVLGSTLFFIYPPLADVFFMLSANLLHQLMALLTFMSTWSFSTLQFKLPHIISALNLTFALMTIVLAVMRRRLLWCISLVCLSIEIILNAQRAIHSYHADRMIVFPVGEGLASLIQTSNQVLLFDNGYYFRGYTAAERVLIPSLNALSVWQINTMILSKDNRQHIGGTKVMLTHYTPQTMVVPTELVMFVKHGLDCQHNDESLPMQLRRLPVQSSCAFELVVKSHRIWLIADITPLEWQQLARLTPPDILLMPRQGSSKGFHWLEPMKNHPMIVILSTKKIHADVMESLRYPNLKVVNANDGMIEIDLKMNQPQVKQMSLSAKHWWL